MNQLYSELYRLPVYISLFWFVFLLPGSRGKSYLSHLSVFFLLSSLFYLSILLSGKHHFLFPVIIGLLTYSVIFIYSFTTLITGRNLSLKKLSYHFIFPLVLVGLGIGSIYFSKNINITRPAGTSSFSKESLGYLSFLFLVLSTTLFIVYYLALLSKILNGYSQYLHDFFSTLNHLHLHWFKRTIFPYLFIILALAFFRLFDYPDNVLSAILIITGSSLLWIIGFKSFRQKTIHESGARESDILFKSEQEKNLDEIHNRLVSYFINKKKYLKADLSLSELAIKIGTNRSYLSKIINSNYHVNFNQFVNSLRIKEACNLINKELLGTNLKDIATECGFSNYASFVNAFKKELGILPTEYLNKLKKDPDDK